MSASENLDRETGTFCADRKFCDILLASKGAETVAEILLYFVWARVFFPHFMKGLVQLSHLHFQQEQRERAAFRTAALVTGIRQDICLIPYLALRGIFSELGSVLRRAFEHVGVLTHIWASPGKLQWLENPDSNEYRDAFQSERDGRLQEDLKARGIKKRFAALSLAMPASRYYELLSDLYVHGGSSVPLIHSALDPNELSCWFYNRVGPERGNLDLLTRGVEIICSEIVNLYVTHAEKYQYCCPGAKVGGEKLHELYLFPEPPSPQKQRQIDSMLHALRRENDGERPVARDFYEWLHDSGLSKDAVKPEEIQQFFQASGIEVADDGIPLLPGAVGPPQPCSRCGMLTECGIQGKDNAGPILVCQDCWRLMFTDTERFHREGWAKPPGGKSRGT